jgi:hypothetical protein
MNLVYSPFIRYCRRKPESFSLPQPKLGRMGSLIGGAGRRQADGIAGKCPNPQCNN